MIWVILLVGSLRVSQVVEMFASVYTGSGSVLLAAYGCLALAVCIAIDFGKPTGIKRREAIRLRRRLGVARELLTLLAAVLLIVDLFDLSRKAGWIALVVLGSVHLTLWACRSAGMKGS